MVKLAHVAIVTPGRCGLYETTRELVAALRKQEVDSRIYDPTIEKNTLHPKTEEDRGSPFCDLAWAKDADLLVNHSGLGEDLESHEIPILHVAHGRPRSSFLSEVKGGTPIYSYHYHKNRDPRFQVVFTFWPSHIPYLEVMWPDKPICCIAPPVDLEAWTPDGPSGYSWHGKGGDINIVCTDAWRDDVDPFVAVNAFALYAREHEGAKLHIYGNSKTLSGWSPLLKRIQDDGNLGEVLGWVKGLDNVYRAADLLITPHKIYVRSIREAMACGCPVISGLDAGTDSLRRFAALIESKRTADRSNTRELAEKMFDPNRTASQFITAIKQVALVGVS